jgi:hypothetical protein
MKPIRPIHDKRNQNYERVHDRTHEILDGNIDFGSITGLTGGTESPGNINNKHAQVVSGAANVDFAVPHNLNRVPTGFMVVNKDQQADVWRGLTPWNTNSIFLRSNAATVTMTVMIY